ncbi:VWA domain-containing protein [Natrialba sp. PRR66]|uniref:VWA domain-containing protein n=1 Tax=Natrialba sp. PRR66 TaxID=3098146 RepID=UPI002B1E2EE2|nr:VWA domain-containing protein [Natrialba sp. PRR66]
MSERTNDGVHDHVRVELVRFVRALRRSGASVPVNAGTTAARALCEVGIEDRTRVRTALRATLLTDSGDFEVFDRLFEAFWRRLTTGLEDERSSHPIGDEIEAALESLGDLAADEDTGDVPADFEGDDHSTDRSLAESFAAAVPDSTDDDDKAGGTTARYSPSGSPEMVDGRLRTRESDLEISFRDVTRALASLRGRRFRPGTDDADIRRALRESVNTGGTVLSVPKRERRRTTIRAVLLVDVSRSVLDTVDRGFLIEFLRRARRDWRNARVFFFDEDLRDVTEAVDAPSATEAFEALEAAETAWGGGTRIGRSFERLRETAPDAVDRRTVVFVVSDGLERGDVDVLERELSWIDRRAERVLWLNPLATALSYEPTARGMAAAVPYLDGLFAFAGPNDVAELARQLRQQGAGGRIGYEFDARLDRQTTTRTTQ